MSAAPPRVIRVTFDDRRMLVELADDRLVGVPLAWFPRLRDATPEQRSHYDISPRGLHWEALDEDISVVGLLSMLEMGRAPGVKQIQREPNPSDHRNDELGAAQRDGSTPKGNPVKPSLTAWERHEREDGVKQARASTRLSGFPENPELDALCDRYIAGEIDLDELLALNGMEPSEMRDLRPGRQSEVVPVATEANQPEEPR